MALLMPALLDIVVALGVKTSEGMSWLGTGFFLSHRLPAKEAGAPDRWTAYIVTCRHVVDAVVKSGNAKFFGRVAKSGSAEAVDLTLAVSDNGKYSWLLHPVHPEIDVAVIPIAWNKVRDLVASPRNVQTQDALKLTDMQANGISEGDGVYVIWVSDTGCLGRVA